jgi:hypothetical protein
MNPGDSVTCPGVMAETWMRGPTQCSLTMAVNMPREFARIRISIADDEEFEDLTPAAQWLYLRVLIPDPTLNYAGVADWRPKRLLRKAKGMTLDMLTVAAAELEERTYCLFDLDTEEVLVRSFIRSDEILRNPKMAAAMVKAYRQVSSKTLQAGIVTEVQKAKEEHPEYSSWTFSDTRDDLSGLLIRQGLESVGYTNVIAVPITNPDPGTDYQSDSVPIPPNLNHTLQPATFNKGGLVSGERHQTSEPPSKCPLHINSTGWVPNCGGCADASRTHKAWEEDELARKRRANDAAAKALRDCTHCDEYGWLFGPDGGVLDRKCIIHLGKVG